MAAARVFFHRSPSSPISSCPSSSSSPTCSFPFVCVRKKPFFPGRGGGGVARVWKRKRTPRALPDDNPFSLSNLGLDPSDLGVPPPSLPPDVISSSVPGEVMPGLTDTIITTAAAPPLTSSPASFFFFLPSSFLQPFLDVIPPSLLLFLQNLNLSSLQGGLLVAALLYFLVAPPGVLFGLIDFYLLNFLDVLSRPRWSEKDFYLGKVRGRGNFGTVYEASKLKRGEARPSFMGRDERGDFILKRMKQDYKGGGVRANFLSTGTIASGSAETGRAEMYFNGRMRRSLAGVTAQYLGNFSVSQTGEGFLSGEEFLVWKYEADYTLEDFLTAPNYPDGIEQALFRRTFDDEEVEVRERRVAKTVMKQLFKALEKFHGQGLVHRDIKPSNMLLTNKGRLLLIDLGASADLRMGINYSPKEGLLDPDYCPPEKLVASKKTPRAPSPVLAALGSPLLWFSSAPDLFDTYSAGIVLLQLLIPSLRNPSFLSAFNKELANADYDLGEWRESGSPQATRSDYTVADARGGFGWDLACRLIRPRNVLNRGRLSATGALLHPFFFT